MRTPAKICAGLRHAEAAVATAAQAGRAFATPQPPLSASAPQALRRDHAVAGFAGEGGRRRRRAEVAGKDSVRLQDAECPTCKHRNRPGAKFCGKCGTKLDVPKRNACPKCGKENRPGAKFCGKCGTPLSVPKKDACPKCGKENRPGAKFCGKCGRALTAPPKPTTDVKVSLRGKYDFRPFLESRPAQVDLAHRALGARLTLRATNPAKIDAAKLQDLDWRWVQPDSCEIVVRLPGPEPAEIGAVAVGFSARPGLDRIQVEADGRSIADLARPTNHATEGLLVLDFPPVRARSVRIRMAASDKLWLNEVIVLEAPVEKSILSKGGFDIAPLGLGGCPFYCSPNVRNVAALHDQDPKTVCRIEGASGVVVFAFQGNEEVLVQAFSIRPAEVENIPSRIRVSASLRDPLEHFGKALDFVPARTEGEQVFRFPSPIRARFLRFEIDAAPGKKSAALSEISILEGTDAEYRSVIFRGRDLSSSRGRAKDTLEVEGVPEREPNDDFVRAQPAPMETWVKGELAGAEDRDFFRIKIDPKEDQIPTLELRMVPFLRVKARILDSAGKDLRLLDVQRAGRGSLLRQTMDLPPGDYLLALSTSPVYVALGFDRSGSMGGTVRTTQKAIVEWSKQLPPGFRVALTTTNTDHSVITIHTPYADDAKLLQETAAKMFAYSGVDSWYTIIPKLLDLSDEKVPRDTVGAVIYLTDGVGTGDYRLLWNRLPTSRALIYTIGFGSVGKAPGGYGWSADAGWVSQRGLFNIAWYRGGRYYEPRTLNELVATYRRIFDELKSPPRYAFRLTKEKRRPGTLVTEAPKGENRPLLFILDASGSMMARADGEKTRLEVAKEVMERIVRLLPANSRVGLRAYGHRFHTLNRELARFDTELLIPVGPLNRNLFLRKLRAIRARGGTPIHASLLAAAGDLRGVKRPRVILITDGVESFHRNPAEAARLMRRLHPEMDFSVVGFKIGRILDRKNLEGMALAGRGRYIDAQGSEGLVRSIESSLFPKVAFRVLDSRGRVAFQGHFGDRTDLPEGEYVLDVPGTAIRRNILIRPGGRVRVPQPR